MSKQPGLSERLINQYSNRYLNIILKRQVKRSFRKAYRQMLEGELAETPVYEDVRPLIILGMHRSGTTLLSRLLRQAGIFMGSTRGAATDESLFFQNLNRAVFDVVHAHWDQPQPLLEALQTPELSQLLVHTVHAELNKRPWSYLGAKGLRYNSVTALPPIWGWKDPRTTYTLPLWLQLFPQARVVFIYRNGIDVAQSLYYRNRKLMHSKQFSARCYALEGAFELWEMYNQQCLAQTSALPAEQLHVIRYEDMITEPKQHLEEVLRFLEQQPSVALVRQLGSSIVPSRAYAFTGHERLLQLYAQKRNSALMQQFGYADLV